MDLTTRCPRCETEFVVSTEQLQWRKGYIRCISCAHIFDGYEAIVPDTLEPAIGQTELASAPALVLPSASDLHPRVTQIPIRKRSVEGGSPRSDDDQVQLQTDTLSSGPEFTVGAGIYADSHDATEPAQPDLYVEPRPSRHQALGLEHDDEGTRRSAMAWLWLVVVILGLAAAALVLAYVYRVQIANEVPALRPALERYCQNLACEVEYPRRINQIAIMDSTLQLAPGSRASEGKMTLAVVLRNNYDKPQQWPTLSVELLDFSGAVKERQVLAPPDYLPGPASQQPFAAKSEIRISVVLTVQNAQISGYRLEKYFP